MSNDRTIKEKLNELSSKIVIKKGADSLIVSENEYFKAKVKTEKKDGFYEVVMKVWRPNEIENALNGCYRFRDDLEMLRTMIEVMTFFDGKNELIDFELEMKDNMKVYRFSDLLEVKTDNNLYRFKYLKCE